MIHDGAFMVSSPGPTVEDVRKEFSRVIQDLRTGSMSASEATLRLRMVTASLRATRAQLRAMLLRRRLMQ